MSEYLTPCNSQLVRCKVADPGETRLCRTIASTIIKAGGAGAFEANPCPFEALAVISQADSERAVELRQKLGLVGISDPEEKN